jgi:hypothetical protein
MVGHKKTNYLRPPLPFFLQAISSPPLTYTVLYFKYLPKYGSLRFGGSFICTTSLSDLPQKMQARFIFNVLHIKFLS